MRVDGRRVRRIRRAIYGPVVLAVLGGALAAAGVVGLTTGTDRGSNPNPGTPVAATARTPNPTAKAIPALGRYAVVAQTGRVYVAGQDQTLESSVPPDAEIVGAAEAPDGGLWLASADGRVFGVGTRSLGEHPLGGHGARIVGIAATIAGYWLASADGHVYAIGGAPTQGDPAASNRTPTVGITGANDGGYWIARSDGRVFGYGAQTKQPPPLVRGDRIVAIIAT